jgi:hypothetical protein
MLPCPLELKSGKLGWKSVNDHMHNPWTIVLCLPCALGYLAIVFWEGIYVSGEFITNRVDPRLQYVQ